MIFVFYGLKEYFIYIFYIYFFLCCVSVLYGCFRRENMYLMYKNIFFGYGGVFSLFYEGYWIKSFLWLMTVCVFSCVYDGFDSHLRLSFFFLDRIM